MSINANQRLCRHTQTYKHTYIDWTDYSTCVVPVSWIHTIAINRQ